MPAYHFHAVRAEKSSVSLNAWVPSKAALTYEKLQRSAQLPFKTGSSFNSESDSGAESGYESLDLQLRALARMGSAVYRELVLHDRSKGPFKTKKKKLARKPGALGTYARELQSLMRDTRHTNHNPAVCATEAEDEGQGKPKIDKNCPKTLPEVVCVCADASNSTSSHTSASSDSSDSNNSNNNNNNINESSKALEHQALSRMLLDVYDPAVRVLLLLDHIDELFDLAANDHGKKGTFSGELAASAFVERCFLCVE